MDNEFGEPLQKVHLKQGASYHTLSDIFVPWLEARDITEFVLGE